MVIKIIAEGILLGALLVLVCAVGIRNGVEELSALNEGLKKFFEMHQAEYPIYRKLEKGAKRYFGEK